MNIKKGTKIFLTTCLAVILCTIMIFKTQISANASSVSDIEEVEKIAVTYLLSGFDEHYDISRHDYSLLEYDQTDDNICIYLFVTFWATQSIDSIDDSPYIQGIFDRINTCNQGIINSKDNHFIDTDEKIIISDSTRVYLENELKNLTEQYSLYIGVETDFNYHVKVEANIVNGNIDQNSIVVYAQNYDEYIPIEEFFPISSEELYQKGSEYASDLMNACETLESNNLTETESVARGTEEHYQKLVQYATTYTSSANTCDVCGSTCGAYQNRSAWNNASYPYYSALLHNDCADYMSQAMYYAGITEDSAWYAVRGTTTRSAVWVSVSKLTTHMLNRGVFTTISKSNATYGDLMDMGSHLTMITYKDSFGTYKFSAHTNDRLNEGIVLSDNYTYYRIHF